MGKRLLLCIGVLGFSALCVAGKQSRQLQKLYCKMGNDLIKVKKEHPQTQLLVYALLDQFGKYNAAAKTMATKKGEYKRLLKAELATTESLKKEITDLTDKVVDMKKVLLVADKKLRKDTEQVNQLVEQKNALAKEKEDFLVQKQAFDEEKQQLLAQRDELVKERDSLAHRRAHVSRTSVLVNKEEQIYNNGGISRTSTSAPMSPL